MMGGMDQGMMSISTAHILLCLQFSDSTQMCNYHIEFRSRRRHICVRRRADFKAPSMTSCARHNSRKTLKLVLVLLDAKIGLKPTDLQMLAFLESAKVKYTIILTKADSAGPPPRAAQMAALTTFTLTFFLGHAYNFCKQFPRPIPSIGSTSPVVAHYGRAEKHGPGKEHPGPLQRHPPAAFHPRRARRGRAHVFELARLAPSC